MSIRTGRERELNHQMEMRVLKVVTVGEILVEIMADERGHGFLEPLRLVGPFPSGAPAIFIDQVAKLGQACGIVGCVGDDDFGRVNLERLSRDGVDVKAVEVHPEYVTGSAFVRYRDDGDRDFVFNIKNSACGQLRLTQAALELLGAVSYTHLDVYKRQLLDQVERPEAVFVTNHLMTIGVLQALSLIHICMTSTVFGITIVRIVRKSRTLRPRKWSIASA